MLDPMERALFGRYLRGEMHLAASTVKTKHTQHGLKFYKTSDRPV